jgi:hypothetical protein
LLGAIAARNIEEAETILRQHIKGVDVYFRTLFATENDEEQGADKLAAPGRKRKRAATKEFA